jgi:uncharacterized protein (DUF2235 family)
MAIDKKRLIFCFDGTWNRLDAPNPTNVVLTAESVLPLGPDGIAQVIYYDEGVGTAKGESLSGGIFGAGIEQNLADAYRHLIFNHTPGDDIFVFGFSRGAFTARSFVGLIRNCGIVARCEASRVNEAIALYRSRVPDDQPSRETARRFRAEFAPDTCVEAEEESWRAANVPAYVPGSAPLLTIAYLGVWDTVGALGVPKRYLFASRANSGTEFHDTALSAIVRSARHAVAIDESRLDFEPTLWTGFEDMNAAAGRKPEDADAPYQQKWFPGVHGSVGGGGDFHGLSDQALDWIWDGARMAGLQLDNSPSSRIYRLLPDFREPLDNVDLSGAGRLAGAKAWIVDKVWRRGVRGGGPQSLHHVSVSARRRWHARDLPGGGGDYRPPPLSGVAKALSADETYAMAFPLPPEGSFEIVVVEKGQSLSKIAKARYGDPMRYPEIFAMNRDKLWDENRIYAGMSLRVPLR